MRRCRGTLSYRTDLMFFDTQELDTFVNGRESGAF